MLNISGHLPHPFPAPVGHSHICRKCQNIPVSIKGKKYHSTIYLEDIWVFRERNMERKTAPHIQKNK